MKLILVFLILANTICSSPIKFLSRSPRLLEETITLEYKEAKNLLFNSDSKWKFTILYASDTSLENNAVLTTSILYKGEVTTASCIVRDSSNLDCTLNQFGQTKFDLVQLTNAKAEGISTVTWTGLEGPTHIPIDATLKYEDSFGLTYTVSNYNWAFKVIIKEEALPENGLVKIDIDFKSNIKLTADCIHNNKILSCAFTQSRGNGYIVKISETKTKGSVTWEFPSSLEENFLVIPFALKLVTYSGAIGLELIDNQWNYILNAKTDTTGANHVVITINTKIRNQNGEENLFFTRCNSIDSSTSNTITEYKCKVYGPNQKQTDLVSVSDSNENNASLDWNGQLKKNQIVVRKAELSFERIYDLVFDSSSDARYWTFKIYVSDDENIPNDALVYVDAYGPEAKSNYYKTCSFHDHVLSCTGGSTYERSVTLVQFQGYKNRGSVTWKNVKQKHIPIAMNHSYTFKQISGAFFTDKWNFFISVSNPGSSPKNSKVLLDIKHNTLETTASCQTLLKVNGGGEELIFCTSDALVQTATDEVAINLEKKYGSLTWTSGLSDSNNNINRISLEEKEAEVIFVDAHDLYFSNNKWFFTLDTRGTKNFNIGKYKVDIAVSGKSKSTATCFLKEGMYETKNITFLCACDYENQSKDDLIYITYPKSEGASISFTKEIADYQIILKTELTIKKAHSANQKFGTGWNFIITIDRKENTILPLKSIVFVDVNEANYRAKCIADTENTLSCSSDYTPSTLPSLGYFKREDSSVTWTNVNKEDYIISTSAYKEEDPIEDPEVDPIVTESKNDDSENEAENTEGIKTDETDPNQGHTEGKGKASSSANFYKYIPLYLLVILI